MAEAVPTGDLDLAFVGLYAEQLPPGLVHHPLVDEPLVAVVAPAHPLAGRDGVALDELAVTGPFIEMRRESGVRLQADAAFDVPGSRGPWRSSWARPMPSPATPVWDSAPGWCPPPRHGRTAVWPCCRSMTRGRGTPSASCTGPLRPRRPAPAPSSPSSSERTASSRPGAREGSQPRL